MKNLLDRDTFILEGIWSKGIERSKTGEIRRENIIPESNLDKITEIDLGFPFVFASRNLKLNGRYEITYKEFLEFEDEINKHYGWRLPTEEDIKKISKFKNIKYFPIKIKEKKFIHAENLKTGITMGLPIGFYMLKGYNDIQRRPNEIYVGDHNSKPFHMEIMKSSWTHVPQIRLIKDKKSINEGLWSKGIERSKSGEERIEKQLGHHSFTDGNGKFHKYGYQPKDIDDAIEKISQLIIDKKDEEKIDLNILDMSEMTSLSHIFYKIFCHLNDEMGIDFEKAMKLPLDTSGWNVEKCEDFNSFVDCVMTDIGLETWKINPDIQVTIDKFDGSWYQYNPPSWYYFDIKKYIKQCVDHVSKNKFGVDKERTKELGKKCYWIDFKENVRIQYIPDNVVIRSISNENVLTPKYRCKVDLSQLTTLNNIPKTFIDTRPHSKGFYLGLTLNDITDDIITIPENVTQLHISEHDDVTKLPKELNCSINLYNSNQLGHFEKINGDLFVGNSKLNTLSGCPKIVMGNFDAHNCKITNLIGSPEEVGGDFSCSNNSRLTSLKGCPKRIEKDFNFYSSGVTDIDDFPEYVGGNIDLSGCTHLNSFMGLPDVVEGYLDIGYCNVKSLEGLPKEIKGALVIGGLTLNNKDVTAEDIVKMYPNIKIIKKSKYDAYNLI